MALSENWNLGTVFSKLKELGLLSEGQAVDQTFAIEDLSSRNSNFAVSGERVAFFLKCSNQDPVRAQTIANEARVLALLFQTPLRRSVPNVLRGLEHALVLTLVRRAETVTSLLWSEAPIAETARAIGAALGMLHQIPHGANASAPRPWVLSLHRPSLEYLAELTPIAITLIASLQNSAAISENLDLIRTSWTVDCLCHMDLKGENILVPADGHANPVVVDWELAGSGDPTWDLGSMLAEALKTWVLGMNPYQGHNEHSTAAKGRIQLSRVHEFARNTVESYLETRCDFHASFVRKVVLMSAARLVQSAYELSLMRDANQNWCMTMIQIAENIFRSPGVAQRELFDLKVN